MNVIESVAKTADLDAAKAEAAVGTILAALKMSVKRDTFAPVQDAVPDADQLIGKAAPAPAGGRTGELFAIISELRTPAGAMKVAAQLARAGLSPAEVPRAAQAFMAYIRQTKGDAAADALVAAAPGLRGLGL